MIINSKNMGDDNLKIIYHYFLKIKWIFRLKTQNSISHILIVGKTIFKD